LDINNNKDKNEDKNEDDFDINEIIANTSFN
jgi:hypothetical protein